MTKKERYTEALIHLQEAKSFLGDENLLPTSLSIPKQIEKIQIELCSLLAIENLPGRKK